MILLIADFVNKLINLNKKVTSNKTRHVPVKNELNELLEKVKAVSKKELTKNMINGYKILHGSKYFFQEYGSISFFLA